MSTPTLTETETLYVISGKTYKWSSWIKSLGGVWNILEKHWEISKTDTDRDTIENYLANVQVREKRKRSETMKKVWKRKKEAVDPEKLTERKANFELYEQEMKDKKINHGCMFASYAEKQCFKCKRFVFSVPQHDLITDCTFCGNSFCD